MSLSDEMIFVTWCLGPSYRYRMKQFIKYNRQSKLCNNVKYLIFTDKPEDFDYLKDTDTPIIEINNIFEFIESRGIELAQNEYLPRASDADWAEDSRKHWGQFSYSAKRVIFQRLYELDITRFVLIDPDVYISKNATKEQLDASLNIPPDSVAVVGRVNMHVYRNPNTDKLEIEVPRSMTHSTALDYYRIVYFLLYMIKERINAKYDYNIKLKEFPLYHSINLSEGILHYHHFSSKESLLKYYRVWDEVTRFLYSTEYRSVTCGPGWMIPDFTTLSLTNMLCKFPELDADKPEELFLGMVFYEDKFLMPNTGGLVPANTLEEFAQLNKKALNEWYFQREPYYGWWNFLKDYNIVDEEKWRAFTSRHPELRESAPEYYEESWLPKND